MKTKILASISGLLVSLVTPLAILVPQVSAAVDTCTWTGAGGDDNFTTAANWTGCDNGTVPEDGDSLEFDLASISATENIVNDMSNLQLANVLVVGSGAFQYIITGNDLTLNGGFSGAATGGGFVRFNLNVIIGSNLTLTQDASGVRFNGASSTFTLGSNDITLNHNSNLYLKGLIGSGDVNISQGYVDISGSPMLPSYTGKVQATGSGSLGILGNSLPAQSEVIMNTTGTLTLITGNVTSFFGVPITVGGIATTSNIYTYYDDNDNKLTLSGGLTLTSDIVAQLEVDLDVSAPFEDNGHEIEIAALSEGEISLPGGETVTQTKETITIPSSDKSTASVVVGDNKTYVVNGERGDTTVASGGVLKGTGKVGVLTVHSGGTLAPGESPGCLASGNLDLAGTFQVEIAGTTVCTQYDQTVVTGTVDVAGATLDIDLLNGFIPALNNAFIIINNDAADAIVGTFTGMADGSTFVVDGVTYQINYNAGDGNDIVLLATAVPAVPDTGVGALLTNPIFALASMISALLVVGGLKFAEQRRN